MEREAGKRCELLKHLDVFMRPRIAYCDAPLGIVEPQHRVRALLKQPDLKRPVHDDSAHERSQLGRWVKHYVSKMQKRLFGRTGHGALL